MNVEKLSDTKGSSCNFCTRSRDEIIETYEISRLCNGGLVASICKKCIEVLNEKIAMGDV